jgi:hypothetical protein
MDQQSSSSECPSQETLCTKCQFYTVVNAGDYCDECDAQYIYHCYGCECNHDREVIPSVFLCDEDLCRKNFSKFYELLGRTLCELAFPAWTFGERGTDLTWTKLFDLFESQEMNDSVLALHLIGSLMISNQLNVHNIHEGYQKMRKVWDGDVESASLLKRGHDGSQLEGEPPTKKYKPDAI